MATFPTSPIPNSTDAPSVFDPVFESRYDGGAIATRSRFLKARRIFVLSFTTDVNGYYIIEDFMHQVRGRALTFDWTYPQVQSIEEVKDTTPIGLVTRFNHQFSTGDRVVITDCNPAVNGVQTVTRTGPFDLTVDGTTASGTQNDGGKITWYFPKMRFVIPEGTRPAPTKLRGPLTDNHGIVRYQVTLEEDF